MAWSVAGISSEEVRLVKLALSSLDEKIGLEGDVTDHSLSGLYVLCVDLLDHFMNALYTEMFSAKTEIIFWEKYHQSSSWEKTFVQYNNFVFQTLRNLVKRGSPSKMQLALQDPDSILYYVESLKSDFSDLAIVLSELVKSASLLQAIAQHFVDKNVLGHYKDGHDEDIASQGTVCLKTHSNLYNLMDGDEVYDLRDMAFNNLHCFLRAFCSTLDNHSIRLIKEVDAVERVAEKLRGSDEEVTAFELETLASHWIACLQARQTWSILHPSKLYFDRDSFPLAVVNRYLPRPSRAERNFVRNVLYVCGASTVFYHYVLPLVLDRDLLNTKLQALGDFVASKVQEKVVEPLGELSQELFDTIRSRETIVTRRDLELSKQSLERMLEDFSNSQQGFQLIFPDMSLEEIKEHLTNNKIVNSFKGQVSAPDAKVHVRTMETPSGVSRPPAAGSSQPVDGIDELVVLLPSAEQALQALMREYEKELQTPIRGMLFGSLFSAILIQMQKLKVHTEAAMLTMDQILASNELTIAATAALPALGLFGFVMYRLRRLFSGPSTSVPQAHCLHLRMILADMDRSYDHLLGCVLAADPQPRSSSMFMDEAASPGPIPLSPMRSFPQAVLDSADPDDKARQILIAEGMCYFHAKRLRNKVEEVLFYAQPHARGAMQRAAQQAQLALRLRSNQSLLFHLQKAQEKDELVPASAYFVVSEAWRSTKELFSALFNLIFGAAPDLPAGEVALQQSLERDLSLLEAPFSANTAAARAVAMNASFIMGSSINRDYAALWHGVRRKQAVAMQMKGAYPWFTPK